jgi:hypothetical protein
MHVFAERGRMHDVECKIAVAIGELRVDDDVWFGWIG